MKTISVNVPDAVYQDLLDCARQTGKSAEDLVSAAVEAMDMHWKQVPQRRRSVLSLKPLDLGKMLRPLSTEDDVFGEMLNGNGD